MTLTEAGRRTMLERARGLEDPIKQRYRKENRLVTAYIPSVTTDNEGIRIMTVKETEVFKTPEDCAAYLNEIGLLADTIKEELRRKKP